MKSLYTHIFIYLFLFLFTHLNAEAQYNKKWEKGIEEFAHFSDVVELENGDVILATNDRQGHIEMMRLNENGGKVWQKALAIGGKLEVVSMCKVNYQVAILAIKDNSKTVVIQIDDAGREKWRKSFSDVFGYHIAFSDKGKLFVAGESFYKNANFWAAMLSKDGRVVWEKSINSSVTEVAYSIAPTKDGGCVLAGESNRQVLAIRLSAKGEVVWDKLYGENGYQHFAKHISVLPNDNFLISGYESKTGFKKREDCWLMKIDSRGKEVWKKNLGKEYDNEYAVLSRPNNNNLIVGANIENRNGKQAWLFGLNTQREMIWSEKLRKNQGTIMHNFLQTKDKGIVVVGSKIDSYGQKMAWIVKLKNERTTANSTPPQANIKPNSQAAAKPNYADNRPPKPYMKPTSSENKPSQSNSSNTARETAKRDSNAPQIAVYQPIIDKNKSVTVKSNSIKIEGLVRDESKLVSIQIGEYPQNVSRTSTKKSDFSATIHLNIGQNKIDIRAIDEHGNLATETLFITYETVRDITGPDLQITSPLLDGNAFATIFEKNVKIKGFATDASGVRSVSVGGNPAVLAKKGEKETTFEATVLLKKEGEHRIEIVAFDEKGNTQHYFCKLQFEDMEITPTKGKNYILTIAVDEYYLQSQRNLNNPVKDSKAVVAALQNRYQFSKQNTVALYNKEATSQSIRQAFREMVQKLTKDDNLIIYYSGHGVYDKVIDEGYWTPYNTDPNNYKSYISNSDILTFVKSMKAKHVFVISDACFSGSLFAEKKGFLQNVEKFPSRWCLASGRLETVSDGIAGYNSPFADAILTYLNQNSKPMFASSELAQYVKITVANNTEQTPIGNPLRNVGDKGGEFVFKLKQALIK
ncbi:MAG: caspase family protein [Chitinophagales bacterium]